MNDHIVVPVWLRIGDTGETQIGTITTDSTEGLLTVMPDFLRAAADACERAAATYLEDQ